MNIEIIVCVIGNVIFCYYFTSLSITRFFSKSHLFPANAENRKDKLNYKYAYFQMLHK